MREVVPVTTAARNLAVRETASELAGASLSENTRRAYAGALRRLDRWLDGRRLDDAALAAYLASLYEAGRSPAGHLIGHRRHRSAILVLLRGHRRGWSRH